MREVTFRTIYGCFGNREAQGDTASVATIILGDGDGYTVLPSVDRSGATAVGSGKAAGIAPGLGSASIAGVCLAIIFAILRGDTLNGDRSFRGGLDGDSNGNIIVILSLYCNSQSSRLLAAVQTEG